MTLLSNTLEVQEKTSYLLSIGIRVYPKPVRFGYRIIQERLTDSGRWGYAKEYQKTLSEKDWVDAYVKTIIHLYNKHTNQQSA